MYCSQCGAHNTSDKKFCSECGAKLIRPREAQKVYEEDIEIEKNQVIKTNSESKKLAITMFVLLILAGVSEILSLYIPYAAAVFSILGLAILIAFFVVFIIRKIKIRKLNTSLLLDENTSEDNTKSNNNEQ